MLDRENTLLLIIDVQGKLATLMQDTEAYLANLKIMIQGAKILGLPILWAEQIPEKLGATLPEIAALLENQEPIAKRSFSCLGNEQLHQALADCGRKQILITGIETHICVYQTVADLTRQGKEVHIVTDAVASRTDANKQLGLNKMVDAGALLTSTETCLFELMKVAGTDEFRQIARLVK